MKLSNTKGSLGKSNSSIIFKKYCLKFLCELNSPEYNNEVDEQEDDPNRDEPDEAELDINKIEENMLRVRRFFI